VDRARPDRVHGQCASKPEISDFDGPVSGEKNVAGLNVAVQRAAAVVEELQPFAQLADVVEQDVLGEARAGLTITLNDGREVAAGRKLEHHEELVVFLECVDAFDQARVRAQ
jgi:hypothetical protein